MNDECALEKELQVFRLDDFVDKSIITEIFFYVGFILTIAPACDQNFMETINST